MFNNLALASKSSMQTRYCSSMYSGTCTRHQQSSKHGMTLLMMQSDQCTLMPYEGVCMSTYQASKGQNKRVQKMMHLVSTRRCLLAHIRKAYDAGT